MYLPSVSQYHHVLKTQFPIGGFQVQAKLIAGYLHGGRLHHLRLSRSLLPLGYGWHQGTHYAKHEEEGRFLIILFCRVL